MNKYIDWLDKEMKEHPKDVRKAYLIVAIVTMSVIVTLYLLQWIGLIPNLDG